MSHHHWVDSVFPPIYAAVCVAVVMAPAVAIAVASTRGGMGDAKSVDLLLASAVVGAAMGVFSWSRLRAEERVAVRRGDVWIAALDSLAVLTLGATVLPLAVLFVFVEEHAFMAQKGFPVVALWAGVQVVAVVLAELAGRLAFWWMEPHRPRGRWLPWRHDDTPEDPEAEAMEPSGLIEPDDADATTPTDALVRAPME